jgi:monoamine oxidase
VNKLCDLAHEFVVAGSGAEAAGAIDRTLVHPWGTDPLAKGSYSSVTVGRVSARTTLAAPLDDQRYFAGQAISTTAQSALHGAYLTSQRAAANIFEHLAAATG